VSVKTRRDRRQWLRRAIVPRLLGVEQAALYLGVSTDYIRRQVAAGALIRVELHRHRPARSPGTGRGHLEEGARVLVDRADLDRLIEVWNAGAGS
jgi:hypothetical protein